MSSPAVRRLARTLTDPLAAMSGAPVPQRIYTTVTSVTAGGSLDGTYAVSVAVNADNMPAPYLNGYLAGGHTPTVGDQVAVDLVNGSPIIIGRVVGLPVV